MPLPTAVSAIPTTAPVPARAKSPASGWSVMRASTSCPTASWPKGSALVIYAEQCHPKGDTDWWDYKRRHFGADDGIEFIEAERLIPLFDRDMGATHLNVQLTETEIALSLITR